MGFTIAEILDFLGRHKQRATYGAVADVLGVHATSVGGVLGERRAEASWVVSATDGRPTGYADHQLHPGLLLNPEIIRSGDELRRRMQAEWHDVGAADELSRRPVQPVTLGRTVLALTHHEGRFGAISGVCNHVGGPLGEGRLDGEYVVCPWHYWRFHARTGAGEPGYEDDRVPAHDVRVDGGRVFVRLEPRSGRQRKPHAPHPLARPPRREDGPLRVLGLSTTVMTAGEPRYSTSEDLLEHALRSAESEGCETRLLRVRDLAFRACEGFYSKSAHACTWPCSITQLDPRDQMDQVYEGVVHWADVIVVATPIRWGGASSLYYKMIERMNCIQNQETIANRHLLRDKVAGFIITGGQDNVQGVAGQLLGFFAEIGCQFPQFPYVAHSRGWSAEDMENNQRAVRDSAALHAGAAALVRRCVDMARVMISGSLGAEALVRGGRKGSGTRA